MAGLIGARQMFAERLVPIANTTPRPSPEADGEKLNPDPTISGNRIAVDLRKGGVERHAVDVVTLEGAVSEEHAIRRNAERVSQPEGTGPQSANRPRGRQGTAVQRDDLPVAIVRRTIAAAIADDEQPSPIRPPHRLRRTGSCRSGSPVAWSCRREGSSIHSLSPAAGVGREVGDLRSIR